MTELVWRQPDQYHIASACGRFTVARIRVCDVDHYVAFRREPTVSVVRSHELAVRTVPPRATDSDRTAAIRAMQRVCCEAADALPPNP